MATLPAAKQAASIESLLTSAQFVIDAAGNKTAVLLDYAMWEELVALLEDLGENIPHGRGGEPAELQAWETLSDEALENFEASLE